MHIAIDAMPISENSPAGVATYSLNLLNNIAALDGVNRYTIYGSRFNLHDLGIKNENFKNNPPPIIFNHPSPWYYWIPWYYTGFPFQLLLSKPDIYLSTYPALPWYCPCPKIITVYDLTSQFMKDNFMMHTRLRMGYQIAYAVKNADRIISVSNYTKKDIINILGIAPEKISVIYAGYDDKTFKPVEKFQVEKTLHKYNISGKYILFTGTFEPKKNIPRLIDAFSRLKKNHRIQHKLVLSGKRTYGDKTIFDLISATGYDKDIIITGYIPREDLPLLMNGAELFIFPSIHEGFGIPPLEAMACGTPVIASNTCSLPEVVGAAGLLVNPYDADAIAEAMYTVLSNENLRETMKCRGIERAKLFSWRKSAWEVLNVIESVYHDGHKDRHRVL